MTLPLVIVVMGTTATGKSSVAVCLAEMLEADFVEGDDLHPEENVEKMSEGIPLTDEDRWPWLEFVAERIREAVTSQQRLVVTCSALKRSYRDVLRGDDETAQQVLFCHLWGDITLLEQRIGGRRGHFMPTSMVASQVDTLEPLEDDEHGIRVDVSPPLDEVIDRVVTKIAAAS